ncbi:MAG TPA: pyridoxine 5'-phosphate synthase [Thermodesulfovibrionales bacterium]|jgi:pyridoxine 5-phosphate synthase|nr:pyridoxine 5'-phosphate synthase [Thermodesulfovibrionales bacterium]
MILGVNVDHVATLREARKGIEPDPLMAATLAILGGADGITLHLREDRRHIKDRDLKLLREMVPVELNLEMAATDEMISIALSTKPDMVTLVPEKRQELTTEGGLDLADRKTAISEAIKKLRDSGIPVSLFIDPLSMDVDISGKIGADMVELHTGYYANAKGEKQREEFLRVKDAAKIAEQSGLKVNAGHGLNYSNVTAIAGINGIRGLYIGHSIVSRAVLVGMERAVREMKGLMKG